MGKFLNEFKAFAVKGNAVDMAVGVIIGGAFGKIVSSIVDDIIMPPIGWLIGGIILFLWGKKLHNPETNITILYDENGQGYKFKKHNDTLFWIPMEYCGILWIVGSVIYLFTA